jgi:diketogulonate reductase-like aldo/keto reductase
MQNNGQPAKSQTERQEIPQFLYGTAWKEDRTERLTLLALQQGFRGIDTANQRRHYIEAAVGDAVTAAITSGLVTRNDLFLQTKFTFQQGQDHRLPYDSAAAIGDQVQQSFLSSLDHLKTDHLDSYVLHGPSVRVGLGADDWAAWQAMESIHQTGKVKYLGISNVSLDQLRLLCERATIRPKFVQNRCYAVRGWDRDVRMFCNANGLIYQGFSLLTANQGVLARPELARIAQHNGWTISQTVFRFAIDIGMVPLTGTSNPDHMQHDLQVSDFHLTADEVRQIEMLAVI